MKRITVLAAVLVFVVLAFCVTGRVHGAPRAAGTLPGSVRDTLFTPQQLDPAVLTPILQNETLTNMFAVRLSSSIDRMIANMTFDKKKYQWMAREFDKDARTIRFHNSRVARFTFENVTNVNHGNFFSVYRNDLKLTDDDQMLEIRVKDEVLDLPTGQTTYTHRRYRQMHEGVPVLGAQFILHEQDGKLVSGSGDLAGDIDIGVTPAVSMENAKAAALTEVNADIYSWQSTPCIGVDCIPNNDPMVGGWFCAENVTGNCTAVSGEYPWLCTGDVTSGNVEEPIPGWCDEPEGELAILSKQAAMTSGSYVLVWAFNITASQPRESTRVLVDAMTGDVLSAQDLAFFDINGSDVTCQGLTRYDGQQGFRATLGQDGFYYLYEMEDASLGRPLMTVMDTSTLAGYAGDYPAPTFPGGDNENGIYRTPIEGGCFFDDAEDLLGTSVMWALEKSWDFYTHFGWYGLDGVAEKPVYSFIHYHPTAPSHYDFAADVIFFSGVADSVSYESVGLTTVGHEYGHAVTFGMVPYLGEGGLQPETRTVLEGIATILSLATESFLKGGVFDWCYGEERKPDGMCILDFSDPKAWSFPDTYGGDYWVPVDMDAVGNPTSRCTPDNDWCHRNAAIMPYWYSLLVEGGTGVNDNGDFYSVDPIDDLVAARIFLSSIWRNMDSTTNFKDFSHGTIDSAKALYPDNAAIVASVQNAWHAVGVGEAYDYGSFSPKNGDPDVSAWPVRLAWETESDADEVVLVSMSPAFDKSFVLDSFEDMPLLDIGGSLTSKVRRIAKINLRADRTYYWRVVTLNAGTNPGGGEVLQYGKGFYMLPWLGNIAQIQDPGSPSAPNYITTPTYAGASSTPTRYFKTSKMRPEIVAPNGAVKAHPWQANFVMSEVPGAESVWVDITDEGTGGFERVIKDTDEVADNANNTYVVKRDLKVDHHYSWEATAQGPDVNDDLGLSITVGKQSDAHSFWTSRPKVGLITPTEGMEVQPEALFQWTKLEGIDTALGNGAHYRLLVSEHSDLSTPVVAMDDLMNTEQLSNLPPTDSAGLPADYYWSILPIGPTEYGEEGELAPPLHFTVDASATKPVGKFPQGVALYGEEVAFRWMPVADASEYEVRMYDAGQTLVWSKTVSLGELLTWADDSVGFKVPNVNTIISDLGTRYWEVRGIFNGNPGLPSDQLNFRIRAAAPELIQPLEGQPYQKRASDPVLFAWEAPFAPDGYKLAIYRGDSCAGQKVAEVVIPYQNIQSYTDFAGSNEEGPFAWRVWLLQPDGNPADFSECARFNIVIDEDGDETPGTCSAPPTPEIIAPEIIPFDTVLYPGTQVEWTASAGAAHYRIVILKQSQTSGLFEEKCQYLSTTTYTMPLNNCVHELVGTYLFEVYAESACVEVGPPASFVYWVQ